MVYLLRKNIKIRRPSNKLDYTKLGPYLIKKKKGLVTFKLDLLKIIRIHPIFYKLLLEPYYNPNVRLEPVEVDPEI